MESLEFNPKTTSNCNTYIAHEVNGKVFNNRSHLIPASSATTALRTAKKNGMIAPVISAVIKTHGKQDALIQMQEERKAFNNNYKSIQQDDDYPF